MLDGVWWEIYKPVSLFLGLGALIALLLNRENRGWRKLLLWGGLGLLSSSVLLSMVFEDLLPTLPTLPEERRLRYALSFPTYLIALVLLVYGGWRFVRDSFGYMAKAPAHPRRRAQPRKPSGPAKLRVVLRLWAPSLSMMAGAFCLFFFAASLQHADHFPLGRLWTLFD